MALRIEPGSFLVVVLVCLGSPAAAQIGGSAAVVSDAMFRGRSVSDGRPATTFSLSYEGKTGLYIAGAAAAAIASQSRVRLLSFQENLGYAWRTKSGLSLDVGVIRSDYTEYFRAGDTAHYTEMYIGLAAKNVSVRIHYAPDYFEPHAATIYSEVDGVMQPAPKWRLNAHLGALAQIEGTLPQGTKRYRYDWQLGIARQAGPIELHFDWIGGGPGKDYYEGRARGRSSLVFGIFYAF